ncbi:Uncharacterized protein SCF082_LOCUS43650 [Durusdinium trenchii]|uniref:Vesicle transport protein n=1 Tax=Durusdinium trenchii TaxID=1381693 RepID=A0ABP0QY38_9DINO
MWGPGHALRGQDASCVDHAVTVLDSAQLQTERFFFFGLVCYFLACICLVCLLFDFKGRVLVCSIFTVTLLWLSCKVAKIRRVLMPEKWTTGHLNCKRVKIGELMGDTSLTGERGISTNFATDI